MDDHWGGSMREGGSGPSRDMARATKNRMHVHAYAERSREGWGTRGTRRACMLPPRQSLQQFEECLRGGGGGFMI